MATFADICTKERLIRKNYYSDTYRADFTFNGIRKKRDIQHISIPFTPEKEIILKTRFKITDEDLNQFYEDFGKNVLHHDRMLKEIQEKSDFNIDKSTAYIEKMVVIKKPSGNGSDVYLLMDPVEPFVGKTNTIITDTKTTLHGILDTGMRLLQSIKNYNDAGICVGTIDLDSVYITPGENGKSIVKDGFFFFASGSDSPSRITKDAYTHLPDEVIIGKRGISPDSDMYVLCSILWSMLDGKHYTEAPDLTHPPRYAPPSLAEALMKGMENGVAERKNIGTQLRQIKKTINDGFITFEEPLYRQDMENALHEYKLMHVELDNEDESEKEEYNKEEEIEEDTSIFIDNMSKKQKVLVGAIAGFLAIGAVICSFFGGKILGEKGWGFREASISTSTATPAVETASPIPEDKIIYTPAPYPTSKPMSEDEYPVLNMDTEYSWFRSEYPATDYCAICFTNSYEISDEIIERWNFYIENGSVTCYVIKRPKFKTDINCNSEGGDKVLIISGNGAGKMKIAMRQTELGEYLSYKFTYGVLNGLSTLISTGSTPFIIPVNTPVPSPEQTEIPEPTHTPENITDYMNDQYIREEDFRSSVPDNKDRNGNNNNNMTNTGNNGYNSNGNVYTGTTGGQTVTTPNWNDTSSWALDGNTGNGWTEEPGTMTQGSNIGAITTNTLTLVATNAIIHVGESTEVYNAGNTGLFTSIVSSNMQAIDVSTVPDANGRYRVTGLNVGTANISVVDQFGQTTMITIQCIPNN